MKKKELIELLSMIPDDAEIFDCNEQLLERVITYYNFDTAKCDQVCLVFKSNSHTIMRVGNGKSGDGGSREKT